MASARICSRSFFSTLTFTAWPSTVYRHQLLAMSAVQRRAGLHDQHASLSHIDEKPKNSHHGQQHRVTSVPASKSSIISCQVFCAAQSPHHEHQLAFLSKAASKKTRIISISWSLLASCIVNISTSSVRPLQTPHDAWTVSSRCRVNSHSVHRIFGCRRSFGSSGTRDGLREQHVSRETYTAVALCSERGADRYYMFHPNRLA